MPIINPNSRRFIVLTSLVAALFLYSCSVITSTMKPGAVDISTETRKNGHLVQIRFGHPVGPVTALLAQGHWLVVTIADTLLDVDGLESFRSSTIDSVDVTRFSIALQLAFHLTIEANAVEVIHDDPSREVLISLFTNKKR
jgi:hypothetical protein